MKESKTKLENIKKNDLLDDVLNLNTPTDQYVLGEEQRAVEHVGSLDDDEDAPRHVDAEDDVEVSMDDSYVACRADACSLCDHRFEKKLIYTDGDAFFCNACAEKMDDLVKQVA